MAGADDSFAHFLTAPDGSLWVTAPDHAVRLQLDPTMQNVVSRREYGAERGMPTPPLRLLSHAGTPVFASPQGIYRYEPGTDSIVPADTIEGEVRALATRGDVTALLGRHTVSILHADGRRTDVSLPGREYEAIPGFEALAVVDDSTLVIPGEQGFTLLEAARVSDDPGTRFAYIAALGTPDSILYRHNFADVMPQLELPHAANLRILPGTAPGIDATHLRFQWRLNDGPWTAIERPHPIELYDLKPGRYRFQLAALTGTGRESVDTITFAVASPAWLHPWAVAGYLVVLMALAFTLQRFDRVRLRRQKARAVAGMEQQMHEQEQDFRTLTERQQEQIRSLEHEKLEAELRHKSQEMANAMVNVTRKNEMLERIKRDIEHVAETLTGTQGQRTRRQLMEIIRNIDGNIAGDRVLTQIEEHFDVAHGNFINRLKEAHPELTHNERIMCAYVRMNLSSKDIAPVFNISVRGVETMRYRLRRKLGLEGSRTLKEYLDKL